MRMLRRALGACLALLLSACAATGPKFIEVEASLPEVRPGEGRIFIFREHSTVGGGVRPDIRLNGQVVGSPPGGGFFFVDRPAGRYTATARTEIESRVEFELPEGQAAYVSIHINVGFVVGRPQLFVHPPVTGAAALRYLSYAGTIPLVPGRASPVTAGTLPGGAPQSPPQAAPHPAQQAAMPSAVTMDDLRGLLPPAKPTGSTP